MHQTQTGLQLEQNSMQIPGNDTGTPNFVTNKQYDESHYGMS